ncbi:MAG: MBL fold metallo-hydrolase [Bacteroidetes bacterium]|nr:MBL fold metallo-hydrolase [Bacteroidota bacterium]
MTCYPLSEGRFTIDQTKIFLPFDPAIDSLTERTRGSLLVEIQPFAIKTASDLLLLDTGLGFLDQGELQIHRNLRAIGFTPDQVTKVFLSHLHKDHAGGVASGSGPSRKLSFPQATYYISQAEFAFAFQKGAPSYPLNELEILANHPYVHWVVGDTRIDGYIDVMNSGGHCPFHQVIRIQEGEQIIFFGGDEAPQLQQMKHRFVAKYDHDGKKAQQLRQLWWQQGEERGWTFLFYHDIQHPSWTFPAPSL